MAAIYYDNIYIRITRDGSFAAEQTIPCSEIASRGVPIRAENLELVRLQRRLETARSLGGEKIYDSWNDILRCKVRESQDKAYSEEYFWYEIRDQNEFRDAIKIQSRRFRQDLSLLRLEFDFTSPYDFINATIRIRPKDIPRQFHDIDCVEIKSDVDRHSRPLLPEHLSFHKLNHSLASYAQKSGQGYYDPKSRRLVYKASASWSWRIIQTEREFRNAITLQSRRESQDKLNMVIEFRIDDTPEKKIQDIERDRSQPGSRPLFSYPSGRNPLSNYTGFSNTGFGRPEESEQSDPSGMINFDSIFVITAEGYDEEGETENVLVAKIKVFDVANGKKNKLSSYDFQFEKFKTVVHRNTSETPLPYNRWTDDIRSNFKSDAFHVIDSEEKFRRELKWQASSFQTSQNRGPLELQFNYARKAEYQTPTRPRPPARPHYPGINPPNEDVVQLDEAEPSGRKRKAGESIFADLVAPTDEKKRKGPVGPSGPAPKRIKGNDSRPYHIDMSNEELDDIGQPMDPGGDPKKNDDAEGDAEDEEFAANSLIMASEVFEQWDEEQWKKCCQFFKHIELSSKERKNFIIPGFRGPKKDQSVFQHQAYAVFWMLYKGKELGGGWLGDHMGLGKTRTILLLVFTQVWVNEAIQGLENDRQNGAHEHLAPSGGDYQQNIDDKCPSDRFNICCPCVESGLTAKLVSKNGPQLILVPASLVGTWRDEFHKVISPSPCPFVKSLKLYIEFGNDNLRGKEPSLRCTLCVANDKNHKECIPDPAQNGTIVLTSPESFVSRIQKSDTYHVEHKGKERRVGISWAVAIADEAHIKHNPEALGTAPSLIIRARGHPYVWAVSGTPMKIGPKDLIDWLQVVWTCAYENVSTKVEEAMDRNASLDEMRDLNDRYGKAVQDFKKLSKADANDQAVLNRLHDEMKKITTELNEVLSKQMIRRVAETKWRGQEIARLPRMDKQDVYCEELAQEWQSKMEKYEEEAREGKAKLSKKNDDSSSSRERVVFRLRMMATIPALADEVFKDFALTGSEIGAQKWWTNPKTSPYYRHLDIIYESSPKLQLLEHWLKKEVENGETAIWGKPDAPPRKEQILISSSFPVIAFIIYVWIQRRFRADPTQLLADRRKLGEQTHMIYSNMNHKQRENIIFAFQNDKGTKEDPSMNIEVENKCRIIVTTNEVMGFGFTLNRARRVVLTEPDWTTANEEQVYARVHRIGGLNEETWARRMITWNNPTEQDIIQRQTARNIATQLVFQGEAQQPEGPDKKRITKFPPNNSPPIPSSTSEDSPEAKKARDNQAKADIQKDADREKKIGEIKKTYRDKAAEDKKNQEAEIAEVQKEAGPSKGKGKKQAKPKPKEKKLTPAQQKKADEAERKKAEKEAAKNAKKAAKDAAEAKKNADLEMNRKIRANTRKPAATKKEKAKPKPKQARNPRQKAPARSPPPPDPDWA